MPSDESHQPAADDAEYQLKLEAFRCTLREAEAQSARGESRPLDLEALFERVDKCLADRGIRE
jgi:hypothetical protein